VEDGRKWWLYCSTALHRIVDADVLLVRLPMRMLRLQSLSSNGSKNTVQWLEEHRAFVFSMLGFASRCRSRI
jgi:hypothetical protein